LLRRTLPETLEDWDDSIKALAALPDVLAMMNEDLDWTSKLGDAVLAQQADVMDAIQRLRALAQSNGKLESNEHQTVTVTEAVSEPSAGETDQPMAEQAAQPVIVIEPTSPETVYVPYYQPSVVYGGWPYPDYPPYYFEPRPGYIFGGAIANGIAWSAGFAIGNAIWGDGFDWRRDNIRVNANRNVTINNKNVNVSNWQHNSYHRRGVNYKNTKVQNKYSKGSVADKRPDFRGRGDGLGHQKPDLGDKRPGGGGLADKKPDLGGKRPNVGDMQAALKKKPAAKKPNVKHSGGNAFDVRDGAKAKDFSKRGHASAGNRSPSKIAPKKPAIKKPAAKKPAIKKPAARKPSIKKGGGKGRGGGGKRRR